MAPNKCSLINKVRRMRDAIDGGTTTAAATATVTGATNANCANLAHLRSHDLIDTTATSGSHRQMGGSNAAARLRTNNVNKNEVKPIKQQTGKQAHLLLKQQDHNYNIPRKERAPKRLNPPPIEETEEEQQQAMGLGSLPFPPPPPPPPLAASGQMSQCPGAKAPFCNGANNHHHQHPATRIKREATQCKQLEANSSSKRETQYNMAGQSRVHSTGADCNAGGRLAGLPCKSQDPAMLQNSHHNNYHHQHRQHYAPTCQPAPKLPVEGDPGNKHHQPHCVYYQSSNCSNKQQQQYLDRLAEPDHHSMPDMFMADTRCKQQLQHHHRNSSKYPSRSQPNQQDKYLLVEYRPSHRIATELHATNNINNRSCHSSEHSTAGIKLQVDTGDGGSGGSNGNGNSNSKRTTIKFISQLYFLLHLSAVLSLLFYHKNLVTSESRWPDDAQQFYSTGVGGHHLNHQKVKNIVNDTTNSPTTTQTTPIILNPLPEPQMLMNLRPNDYISENQQSHNSHHQYHNVVRSVLVAPKPLGHGFRLTSSSSSSSSSSSNNNNNGSRRFGRQTAGPASLAAAAAASARQQQQSQPQPQYHTSNPDILVRLVGPQHARNVLRYFLGYLLMTSVVVLVCLRLFMLCNWRRAKRKFDADSLELMNDAGQRPQETESQINHGFYHRTRLDCTPVLIGSISLGLIQLIVIGLDIAYNFDYLSENRWPANNLPFLQFAFVSLLMQYILGKVAEKREQRKSNASLDGSNSNSKTTKTRRRLEDGNGSGVELANKRALPISNSTRYNGNNGISESPSTGGLENIALAHLLVTHILLWLMKLNSISLFQAIELQSHHHQDPSHQNHYYHHVHGRLQKQQQQQQPYKPFHHDQQSFSNKLYPSIKPPSSPSSPTDPPTYPTSGGDLTLLKNVLSTTSRGDRDTAANGRDVLRNENHLLREQQPPLSPSMGLPPLPPVRHHPVTTNKSRDTIQTHTIPYSNSEATNPRYQPPLSNLNHRPPPPPIAMPPPDEPTSTTYASPNEPPTTTPQPEVAPPDPQQANKGERGLRSAGGQLDRLASSFGASTKVSEVGSPGGRSNSRWAQHLPRGLNVTHPSTTTSTTASPSTSTSTTTSTSRAPDLPAPQPNGEANLAGLTVPKAKSSLPKRMTAFRQRPPSSATVAGSSIVASISQAATAAPGTTSTTTTPEPVTDSPNRQSPPKQRVRVMIHRVEDPVHLEAPELDAARGRRAKQVVAASQSTTTSRPFPSVESDPPIITSTTPSSVPTNLRSTTMRATSKGIRSLAAGSNYDRKTQPAPSYTPVPLPLPPTPLPSPPKPPASKIKPIIMAHRPPDRVFGEEEEEDRINSSTNNHKDTMRAGSKIKGAELANEEESGNIEEDDIEESDIDLDALLPPVPNYAEETPTSAIDNAEDIAVKRPTSSSGSRSRSVDRVSDPVGRNGTVSVANQKKAFDLREDAFVFNEAASEISNSSTNSLQPTYEALVMPQRYQQQQQQQQQHKQDDNKGEPTFADYLMPIVHQYHILIVAILFNMWLDGLRNSGSPSSAATSCSKLPQATYAHQDVSFSNKRLLTSRDLLLASESCASMLGSSGSEAGATVSRSPSPSPNGAGGLVAIPIKDKHGHFKHQHTSLQGFAALDTRLHKSSAGGSHWKQQKFSNNNHHNHYLAHKHLNSRHNHRSRSMESLAHPDCDMLASSSASSTLSRHHSLRSTSSQQLLWVSGVRAGARARSPLLGRQVLAPFPLRQTTSGSGPPRAQVRKSERHYRQQQLDSLAAASRNPQVAAASNSVCSVFFGLIIVSISLIVILVSIDLLSVATQCLTQLITIIVCLSSGSRSRSVDRVSDPVGRNGTVSVANQKKAFDLREDAFVFNEAASEISNSSTNSLQPTYEALVMPQRYQQQQQQQQQHKQDDNKGEPTFADYLMPIVHQYHILIVAILFNMWLDGLRNSGSPSSAATSCSKLPQATYAHQDVSFSNKRLLTSRDLLLASESCASMLGSSGSEAGATVSRSPSPSPNGAGGLVAIPIKDKHGHFKHQHTSLQGFAALDTRLHKSSAGGSHWKQQKFSNNNHHNHYLAHKHLNSRHNHRSRSMESLAHPDCDMLASSSASSTLSRHHSLRSTSSQQLLWVSGVRAGARARSPLLGRQVLAPFPLRQTTSGSGPPRAQVRKSERHYRQQQLDSLAAASRNPQVAAASNSVCSVFFGLIIVSISLIVILVSIDLLSVATQCLTQLITIIVCLVGLLLIWRSNLRRSKKSTEYTFDHRRRRGQGKRRKKTPSDRFCYKNRLLYLTEGSKAHPQPQPQPPTGSHRQCFHYLFLLAAYYCGISIALNLGKQHSMQQLFSPQVIQFIQRHFSQSSSSSSSSKFLLDQMPTATTSQQQQQVNSQWGQPDFTMAPIPLATNYLFLFHLILAAKGLLLILQVTLQTLMIRSSCQGATKELRQIYTFLMFANLSLWALEICEQQQHLQRETLELAAGVASGDNSALPGMAAAQADRLKSSSSLDGFNKFAVSIVTLSHLYHGLVFMQQ